MSFFAAFIHRQFIYEPPVPTASFKNRTVIVTGSNCGLGLEASRWLVRLGASQVILACRNIEKGNAAAKDIQATTSCSADTLQVWQLDMSSYASVIAFADRVKALPRLDVLIANAGLGTLQFRVTEDNEETITTNVVSTSLLACLILPKLRETALKYNTNTHLTITASELYEVAKFKERKAPTGQIFATLNDKAKSEKNMGERYHVSKLLEIFFVKQLAAMSPIDSNKVIVNCVAPGWCHSNLAREADSRAIRIAMKLLCRPTEVGARTLVHGASVGPESHGQYVPDCKITPTGGLTKGEKGAELQGRVWEELRQKLEAIRPGVTSLA
ncbi:short-chain dehydrogenase [Glonium stellatum]|uniref:Short-chain dehydrogenase n=1 Tax=Glonium stellatum TaxID=574774 RepID=A0A8E2ENT3_9PEZI|nr:short-chain dehydrogenase [Glonium stellatum]